MLNFNCTNCGRKIRVPEKYAGRKGKCPKCGNIVGVPESDNVYSLKKNDIETEKPIDIDDALESEYRLKREYDGQPKYEGLSADGLNVSNEFLLTPEFKEVPPERKLPWILDIFLYPTSIPGLVNLAIYTLIPLLITIVSMFLIFPIFLWLIRWVIGGYLLYYLIQCIQDSADGGIRAPENLGSMPGLSEIISRFVEIAAILAMLWAPVIVYNFYKVLTETTTPYTPQTDVNFWLLIGYGIFFTPMGLLAISIFDSSSAFNPLIWIKSIFSTFFQYCFLVVFCCLLGFLALQAATIFQGGLLIWLLFNIAFIYLVMVIAHLIGRFYYKNSEKLNWDV